MGGFETLIPSVRMDTFFVFSGTKPIRNGWGWRMGWLDHLHHPVRTFISLWIKKTRTKDKIYIWGSVSWKSQKLKLRNLHVRMTDGGFSPDQSVSVIRPRIGPLWYSVLTISTKYIKSTVKSWSEKIPIASDRIRESRIIVITWSLRTEYSNDCSSEGENSPALYTYLRFIHKL